MELQLKAVFNNCYICSESSDDGFIVAVMGGHESESGDGFMKKRQWETYIVHGTISK